MNFLGKTRKLILAYYDMPKSFGNEAVNVMLTPQFYTLKREELPVKYPFQAKKVAPSLFEGLIDKEGTYRYFVNKKGDEWEFIAYDPDKIKAFLEDRGIAPQRINKLFFAQQAAERLVKPILLGKDQALVNLNGIATVIPRAAIESDRFCMQVDDTLTPSKGVAFGGKEGSFISREQAISLAAILLLFAVMFLYEGMQYGKSAVDYQPKIDKIIKQHPTLQSKYARQSIVKKYTQVDTTERRKRDLIKTLSKMIFKGVALSTLYVDDQKVSAVFNVQNENEIDKLKALAQKEKLNVIHNTKNEKQIQIEGKL